MTRGVMKAPSPALARHFAGSVGSSLCMQAAHILESRCLIRWRTCPAGVRASGSQASRRRGRGEARGRGAVDGAEMRDGITGGVSVADVVPWTCCVSFQRVFGADCDQSKGRFNLQCQGRRASRRWSRVACCCCGQRVAERHDQDTGTPQMTNTQRPSPATASRRSADCLLLLSTTLDQRRGQSVTA